MSVSIDGINRDIEAANAAFRRIGVVYRQAGEAFVELAKAMGLAWMLANKRDTLRRQAIAKARGRNWRNVR